MIIPTAEPFFFLGEENQPACLLVHGFTGTPKEMRSMGENLNHEHGFHCLGIRLTGHATDPNDMIRSRYTDWIASVQDGYHLLSAVSNRIYLIGLSMGGVLSLLSSTRLDVAGVVALSTPFRSPQDYPAWEMKILSKFQRFRPKGKSPPGANWFDKQAFAGHISYPHNPVRSGAELQLLLAEMRATLPAIKVPVLLIHSKNDTYVLPENMEQFFAALTTSDKTKLYISGSGHVLTSDAARNQVFEAVADFINRIEATT